MKEFDRFFALGLTIGLPILVVGFMLSVQISGCGIWIKLIYDELARIRIELESRSLRGK